MKGINDQTDNARLLVIDVGGLLDVSEKRSGNAGRTIRCFPFDCINIMQLETVGRKLPIDIYTCGPRRPSANLFH